MKPVLAIAFTASLGFSQTFPPPFVQGRQGNVTSPEVIGSQTGIMTLRAALAKAPNGTPAAVAFLGDSITRGTGPTSTAGSWTAIALNQLKQSFGNGGSGFADSENNATPNSGGNSITLSGSWTVVQGIGPSQNDGVATFGTVKSNGASGTATSVIPAGSDTIDLYCATSTDSSAGFTVTIDSASVAPACNATSGSLTMVLVTYSGLDPTVSHTIVATAPNSGNGYLFGFSGRLSTGGVYMVNAAVSGADSSSIATAPQVAWLGLVPNLAAVVIALGVNDTDTSGATLVTNLAAVQAEAASLSVPIIYVFTENNNTNNITALEPAVKNWCATNGYDWVSIADRWGTFANGNTLGLYADTVHPNNAGSNDFANAVLSYLRLAVPNPAFYDPTRLAWEYFGVNGNTTAQQVNLTTSVQTPHTDLVCAAASDNTIAKQTISSATQANPAVLTVPATTDFWNGEKVTISGVTQAGWNGTYSITVNPNSTTITINLDAHALSAISGGTPLVALACSNNTDSTADTAFATSYSAPAGSFTVAGKELDFDVSLALFSAATVTGENFTLKWKSGSGTMYTSSSTAPTANRSDRTFNWRVALRALTALSTAMPIQVASDGPWMPGWTTDNASAQTASVFCCPNVSQSGLASGPTAKFAATGVGGTITYSSGGTATGTGNCLATASGGTGTGAIGLVGVSSGTISGTLSIGPSFAQTNTGSGYGSAPTSWTLTTPTTGSASTCSGTIATTGGSLVGAMGNAIRLLTMRTSWAN